MRMRKWAVDGRWRPRFTLHTSNPDIQGRRMQGVTYEAPHSGCCMRGAACGAPHAGVPNARVLHAGVPLAGCRMGDAAW
eukprot:52246-Chlamydomonas_euryale.AAC.2